MKYSNAKIASALNRIIHKTQFKIRISLEEQKSQKQDIYEYFRVTGANDSVENYADLFTIALRNDDVQEFDSKWDGILFVNDENPIWWNLGRIVQIKNTRVWETQDRIEIWTTWRFTRKFGPDYHRLKTMVKRSIEQDLRINNFEARIGNNEWNAVVKNQGTKQRVQRILGDCWQWEANGQCVKGDNCSFRHDINKRGKIDTAESISEFFHATEWEKCVENPKSQRKESQHPPECSFYKSQSGCRFGKSAPMRIARLKNRLRKGPKKWWQQCSGYVEE